MNKISNKMKIKLLTTLLLALLACGDRKSKLNCIYDLNYINDFSIKNGNAFVTQKGFYSIYFDESSDNISFDNDSKIEKGNYKIIENGEIELVEIYNCSYKLINGTFEIKIDTLMKNEKTTKIDILFKSSKVKFWTRKFINLK